jgi:hypothetical protein
MRIQLLKFASVISLFILAGFSLHAAAPRNDAQSEAFRILDDCYIVGVNSEATHELGELDHAGAGGSKSLWWVWSPSDSVGAILTLRSYGSDAQFALSIYREDVDGELVEVGQINPLSEFGKDFTTQFEAQGGESYFFAVDSLSGSVGGRFYLGLNQAPEFLTPLQVRVGEPFEIPINVAGAPSEVALLNGPESVFYDPSSRTLRGSMAYDYPDQVTLRAANNYGERMVDIVLVPEREKFIYTGAASAVGFVGVPFEYVLSFDEDPQLTSQDIQAYQLPQEFYLAKEAGQWKIKGMPNQWYDTVMRIDIQIPEGKHLYVEIPLLIVELADAQLQPAILSPLMMRGVVGQPFSYQIEMSLPIVDYSSVASLPNGLTLDQESGLISGTPVNNGDQTIQLTANFNYPPYATRAELLVRISEESELAPMIQSPATAVAWVGVPFEYQIEATNGADHYFMNSGLPQGLSLNQETGLIAGTPELAQEHEQLYIVVQNQLGSAESIVTLDILEPDRIAHVTSLAQVSATVGEFFEYQIETNLETFKPHQMSAYNLPSGLEYDEANSRVFGVPQYINDETVEIEFFDNFISVQLRVVENEKPVEFLNAATAVGRVGSFFYFGMNASGADHFSASPPVDGLTFSSQTGVFTGVPTVSGTYKIRVVGYSQHGEPTHAELKIVIMEETEVVPPPIILSPGQLLAEVGETFAYSISSSGYANNNFDVSYLPQGAFFDQASGTLFGSVEQPESWEVEISAGAASAHLHVHFYEPAERPLLVTSAPSAVGRVGELFEYQIETNAAEIGEQDLNFYAGGNFPQSWTLDGNTGLIRGYVQENDLPFDFEVQVNVSGDFTEFRLTIVDGSTGVPAQVVSPAHIVTYPNEAFEYQFVFDQSDVSFDISYLVEGLSYNVATQTLSGAMSHQVQHEIYFQRYEESSGRWFEGQVYLDVRDFQDRPVPLMVSAAGPVANRGEFFSYDVEFDLSGVVWYLANGPQWLTESGAQLVGYVPDDYGYDYEQIYIDCYIEATGYSFQAELTMNLNSPEHPVAVVSPASAHATVGVEFGYQIVVEGAYDEIEVDLPSWASYDPVSMRVTGVPDSREVEEFVFLVTTDGPTIEPRIQVVVEDAWQPAVITSLQPSPVFAGIPYEYQLVIDGPFDYLNYNGPSWLELDGDTLLFSGIPVNTGADWLDVQVQNQIEQTQAYIELFGPQNVAPYISEELQGLVIYPGGKAYFRAKGPPESVDYEWFKDGVSLNWYGDWLNVDDVTIDDQGAYSVRLYNPYAEAWTLPVELQIGQPAAYRDWLIAHIGFDIDEPEYAESSLSFAGDTTPDLMKWALGVDPTSIGSSPLAESSMQREGFQVQFQRSVAPRDIRIVVERSGTLGAEDWDAIAILPPKGSWQALQSDVTVDETGTGSLRSVTVIDSGEFTEYFVRVRIELVSED